MDETTSLGSIETKVSINPFGVEPFCMFYLKQEVSDLNDLRENPLNLIYSFIAFTTTISCSSILGIQQPI